jgi:hypothetical protein
MRLEWLKHDTGVTIRWPHHSVVKCFSNRYANVIYQYLINKAILMSSLDRCVICSLVIETFKKSREQDQDFDQRSRDHLQGFMQRSRDQDQDLTERSREQK